jgi:restriction system protein
MDIIFHYPPDLLNLLIDTIPLLCRSKRDVILFFKGAGVPSTMTNDLVRKINKDKASISKYEIARTILARLNERGEATLRERREILKRVTEFEEFSTCWPIDQLKAKGLVAEIRKVVQVKDSFTRMELEREAERKSRLAEQAAKRCEEEQRRAKQKTIRANLLSLFAESNKQKRGKALEGVLNSLFNAGGILVREAFTVVGLEGEGVVEQIDGVIELDNELYLVEMKWWDKPLGVGDVSQHLVRVFFRDCARGIFISAAGYTEPAITTCRDALQKSVVVLCNLEEIVLLLEKEEDLKEWLREKIKAAIIHKNPLFEPLKANFY